MMRSTASVVAVRTAVAGVAMVLGGASAGVAAASELYVADWNGRVLGFDTGTASQVALIDNLIRPAGVEFRSRSELFVAHDDASLAPNFVLSHFSASPAAAAGWDFTSGRWANGQGDPSIKLSRGAARGPDNRVYVAAQNSHGVFSYGDDHIAPNSSGQPINYGPDVVQALGSGNGVSFPQAVAFDWQTRDAAVTMASSVKLFQGTTLLRTIATGETTYGVTFDPAGRTVAGTDGRAEIHPLVYVVHWDNVVRYDAVTGEAWGADPANRSDPTFIPAGSGGLAGGKGIVIDPDPASRYLYVSASSSGTVNRYDAVTGQPAGLAPGSAAYLTGVGDARYMAFRPEFQSISLPASGTYVLGPDGDVRPIRGADLQLTTPAGQTSWVTMADGVVAGSLTFGAAATDAGRVVGTVPAGARVPSIEITLANGGSLLAAKGATIGGSLIGQAGTNIIASGGLNLIGQAGTNAPAQLAFGPVVLPVTAADTIESSPPSPNVTGPVTVEGDYTQGPATDLVLSIGGRRYDGAVQEYDRLVVDGAATLDGRLLVDYLDLADPGNPAHAFRPAAGDAFDLIVAHDIVLGGLDVYAPSGNGLRYAWDVTTLPDGNESLRLVVTSVPEPATTGAAGLAAAATLLARRRKS